MALTGGIGGGVSGRTRRAGGRTLRWWRRSGPAAGPAVPPPQRLSAEQFRARTAELLEEAAGDELRLAAGLWRWWRRVAAEGPPEG